MDRAGGGSPQAIARAGDPARHAATLFAPAGHREALFALYALRCELAAVPGRVSEPGLGEIRLKWWADQLAGLTAQAATAVPVLDALRPLLAPERIARAPLISLAEAFTRDLYGDPRRT